MKNWFRFTRAEREDIRRAGNASTIGWFFAAAIGIGFGLGYWVDSWAGTEPWGGAVGALLGIGAAFMNLFRVAKELSRDDEERR